MSTEAGTDAAMRAMLEAAPEDSEAAQATAEEVDVEESDDGAEALGDAGKQALARMKAKLKAERERRVAAEERANAAADKDDADRIRREAETAAATKANARIVKAEIRAAAAGKLADPLDALAFLDTNDFEVDEDGDVDSDAIADAIDDLLRRKPHLAAQGGNRKPKPDRSQGAQSTGAGSTAQQFAAAVQNAL